MKKLTLIVMALTILGAFLAGCSPSGGDAGSTAPPTDAAPKDAGK